mgnify:CR=1 FL=1
MGTDELTRIHELAKRVTLLEKTALRQRSRIDELMERLEQVERRAGRSEPARVDLKKQRHEARAEEENIAAEHTVPSVRDLLDEEMKHELTRAYTGQAEKIPDKTPEKPQDKAARTMERATGSYVRAAGGKEPVPSDRAKQNEATRKKTADTATLEKIPTHELRERTPAERTADYIRDYNMLYDVLGTMFQKKKAQDDFIKLYEVQGMRCTNMQLRLSRPELAPRFVSVTPTRDADFWGMPLGNNLFAVVPNPFLVYGEEMHTAGGMREAFNSNYRVGNTYGHFTVKVAATFQFGTIGKVFKKGQLEVRV